MARLSGGVNTACDPAAAPLLARDDVVLTLRAGAAVRWGSAERADRKAQVLRSLLPVRAEVYDVSAPDLPTTSGASD